MTSPTGGRNGKRQVSADTFASSQKFSQPEFVRLAAVPKMWEKSMKILMSGWCNRNRELKSHHG